MGIILNESVEDLISSDESLENNKKQEEYLEYIKEHVLNVQKAFQLHFLPLLDKQFISSKLSDEEIKSAIQTAAKYVLVHDASKYGDEEFDGYREKYYPTAREKADPDFEKISYEKSEIAWIHHYENNPHHPMYWVKENGEIEDMTLAYIIEMLSDWFAMSMKYHSDTWEWYREKAVKEKAAMTDRTKEIVEEFLFEIIKR